MENLLRFWLNGLVPVWLNGWVFVYELSSCGFQSRYSHLHFRYGTCFKQRAHWARTAIECRFTLKLVCDMLVTCSVKQGFENSAKLELLNPLLLSFWYLKKANFKGCESNDILCKRKLCFNKAALKTYARFVGTYM